MSYKKTLPPILPKYFFTKKCIESNHLKIQSPAPHFGQYLITDSYCTPTQPIEIPNFGYGVFVGSKLIEDHAPLLFSTLVFIKDSW